MTNLSPQSLEWMAMYADVAVGGVAILFTISKCWSSQFQMWHAKMQAKGWYHNAFHPYFYIFCLVSYQFLAAFAVWLVQRDGMREIAALDLPPPLSISGAVPWKFQAVNTIYLVNAFCTAFIGIIFCGWGWWTLNLFNHSAILTLSILSTIWTWTMSPDNESIAGGLYLGASIGAFYMWCKAVYFFWWRNDIAAPELHMDHWHTLVTDKGGVTMPANMYQTAVAQRIQPVMSSVPSTANMGNVFTNYASSSAPGHTTSLSFRPGNQQQNILMTTVAPRGYAPLTQ